ncbi:MAG: hypothetical protein ABGZ35_00205, partial [Planctomycetaceae bacterium]
MTVQKVWVDDDIPAGAGSWNVWTWGAKTEHPVLSGSRSVRGIEDRGIAFIGARPGHRIEKGDKIFAHVFLPPLESPRALALTFFTHYWDHRVQWGGAPPSARRYSYASLAGALPQKGEWVRLEVDAQDVGLKPGTILRGWGLQQYGGSVYWDSVGIEHLALRGFPESRVVLDAQGQIHELDLSGSAVTDGTLQRIAKHSTIVSLDLSNTAVTEIVIRYLSELNQLTELKLQYCSNVDDIALNEVSRIGSLRRLDISHTEITDVGLSHISRLVGLKQLNVRGNQISDNGVEKIAALPQLVSLGLQQTNVGDNGLLAIANSPRVSRLSVFGTQVTAEAVGKMRTSNPALTIDHSIEDEMRSLGALVGRRFNGDVSSISAGRLWKEAGFDGNYNGSIRDSSLSHLRDLTQLQSLSLAHTFVTDAGLRHVAGLKFLQTLNLYATGVTDAGFVHLKDLRNLRSLTLNFTNVQDDGLEFLTGLPRLSYLTLSHTAVTDEGMFHVGRMRALTSLYLYNVRITDTGVERIKDLTNLRLLSLYGTNISDACLVHLARLRNLNSLDLTHTNVTAAGVQQLKARLPRCRIMANPQRVVSVTELKALAEALAKALAEAERTSRMLTNGDFSKGFEGWTIEGEDGAIRLFDRGDTKAVTTYGDRRSANTSRLYQCFKVPDDAVRLSFKLHGGRDLAKTYVSLRHKNTQHGRMTSVNNNAPQEKHFSLIGLRGEVVTLEVVDESTGPWGFIGVEDFRVVSTGDVLPVRVAPAAKTPDAATVKKHMTPAQLALGDPVVNSIGMLL